jgi:hypothetical protein
VLKIPIRSTLQVAPIVTGCHVEFNAINLYSHDRNRTDFQLLGRCNLRNHSNMQKARQGKEYGEQTQLHKGYCC